MKLELDEELNQENIEKDLEIGMNIY